MPIPALAAAAILAATAAGLAGRLGWPLELFTHFRPHLIALAVVTALVLAFHDPRCAALCLLAGLANASSLHLAPRTPSHARNEGTAILWANVWHNRSALARTIAYARAQGTDVILLAEFPTVDAAWIRTHAPDYPYIVDPGPQRGLNNTRVVCLSRRSFERTQIEPASIGPTRPMLWLTLRVNDRLLLIGALHPSAPGTAAMQRNRDAFIARAFRSTDVQTVLIGDFNAAPWSPVMEKPGFRRAGAALGGATWPSWPLPLIPIDNLYASPGVTVSDYRVGPALGSDHRPILARLR